MEGAESGPDLLESGGRERRRRWSGSAGPPQDGRPPGRLTRARRPIVWAVVAAAVTGYLTLQWYDSRKPSTPLVVVRQDRSADSQPLWSAGRDGRPASAVTLSVAASLALGTTQHQASSSRLIPLGLAGPGLSQAGAFPHQSVGRLEQSFDLTGQVACDHVPLPVPDTAYTMRARVQNGTRTTDVDVRLPLAASAIAQRVTYGCSTWLAARDLTVTAAQASVDPTRPHLELALQVANAGSHDAVVWMAPTDGTGVRVSDLVLTVPAHGSARTMLTVDLDSCWTWDASSSAVTTTDTPLPLLGAAGVDQPLADDVLPAVQGLNGLVLGPGVATQMQDAFVEACGGVASPALATGVHSSRYVVDTQTLTTTAMADVPVPAVRRVRFVPVADATTNGPFEPRYTPTPWLTPDATGRVSWPLSYTVTPNIVCITGGGAVWIASDVEAQVQTEGGTMRVVTFRLAAEALLPAPQIRAACDAMDAAAGG